MERGQVLPIVALVLLLAGVSLVTGAGDIAVAQHEHERADEAATLGAISGAGVADLAGIYAGETRLDPAGAVTACRSAVAAVAPEAALAENTCRLDPSDPQRRTLVVTVVIAVHLPVPVPFIAPTVRATRRASLAAGTQSAA